MLFNPSQTRGEVGGGGFWGPSHFKVEQLQNRSGYDNQT